MKLKSPVHNLTSRLRRGFTLIELLIVIAIIGILASLIIANVQGVRQRARDARRKSDLDAVQTALRLYYNDNKSFPATAAVVWGNPLQSGSTVYLSQLPSDPSLSGGNPNYIYTQVSSDSYTLRATLENASDPDIAESQARCGGSSTQYAVCE